MTLLDTLMRLMAMGLTFLILTARCESLVPNALISHGRYILYCVTEIRAAYNYMYGS